MILMIVALVIIIFGLSTQIVYLSTRLSDRDEQLEQIETVVFKLTNNKLINNKSRIICKRKNDYEKLVNVFEIKDDYTFVLNYRDGYTESVIQYDLNIIELEKFKNNILKSRDIVSVEIYKML